MEDDSKKIHIIYEGEDKEIDVPDSLEDLLIKFREVFKVKGSFDFSYLGFKYLTERYCNKQINFLIKSGSPLSPVIYANDSAKPFINLLNEKTLIETIIDEKKVKDDLNGTNKINENDVIDLCKTMEKVDTSTKENKINEENNKADLNEINGKNIFDLGKTIETVELNEGNNINDKNIFDLGKTIETVELNEGNNINDKNIFDLGKTVETIDLNDGNKIIEKNNKVDLKENINLLENELKKAKDDINNEINNVKILQEEIYFLNDISKEKIPIEYIKLKNKLEKVEKENEQKSNEIKELNKVNEENIRLKKIIEEKDNTIKNMEKSYKQAINELKENFLKKIKELEENSNII